jgi:hypothetical protein
LSQEHSSFPLTAWTIKQEWDLGIMYSYSQHIDSCFIKVRQFIFQTQYFIHVFCTNQRVINVE